jgi:hypothetical protein
MSSQISEDLTSNIKFVEAHVGGSLDDNEQSFLNQKKLINDSTNDYIRLLNYQNKLDRSKDENDNYVEQLYVELNTNPYRLNTLPTTVGGINYSNPIVYPKEYDPYFEYLASKKLGGLNTRIVLKKTIVNVDSANRISESTLNVTNYLKLEPNTVCFIPNLNKFRIFINKANEKYEIGDKITLRGFKFYKSTFKSLNFYFKDRTNIVVMDLKPNFDFTIPYYDVLISIKGVNYEGKDFYQNIPLNLINQTQKVDIYKLNNDFRLQFTLPITFYAENDLAQTLISDCEITFYNIGNYPISLINATLPLNEFYLVPYHLITDVNTNYIELRLTNEISLNQNIILSGQWSNNNFYTGSDIEIGTITGVNVGYPNVSSFKIFLDKNVNNVASISVISSEIPNILKNVNAEFDFKRAFSSNTNNLYIPTPNNKLYWDNLLDSNTYTISIPTGYYTIPQLQSLITKLMNSTPRITVDDKNIYRFNEFEITLNESSNISTFKSYNKYILPNCLVGYTKLNNIELINPNGNSYIIKINHPDHNLRAGDRIFIFDSTDYYMISRVYINDSSGHLITKIINNDFYEITLTNINLINDTGDTKGGFAIYIKTYNSFRLRFDFDDTIGSIIGFRYVGNPTSITEYSGIKTAYEINNLLPYVYDISKILIANNQVSQYQIFNDFENTSNRYLLLQCTNFNLNQNPNGPPYFYKFLMSGAPNTIIYNSFVNAPVYLNPPIRFLSELEFTFIDPNGNQVNFYNRNYSLTLEITSIDNSPENTNINTFTARL